MSEVRYPVKMLDGIPVVRPPAGIDAANSGALSENLHAGFGLGQATIVVNTTKAYFCDFADFSCWYAPKRAAAEGGELRLVTRYTGLLRMFAADGVDHMFPAFSRLREALDRPTGSRRSRNNPGQYVGVYKGDSTARPTAYRRWLARAAGAPAGTRPRGGPSHDCLLLTSKARWKRGR